VLQAATRARVDVGVVLVRRVAEDSDRGLGDAAQHVDEGERIERGRAAVQVHDGAVRHSRRGEAERGEPAHQSRRVDEDVVGRRPVDGRIRRRHQARADLPAGGETEGDVRRGQRPAREVEERARPVDQPRSLPEEPAVVRACPLLHDADGRRVAHDHPGGAARRDAPREVVHPGDAERRSGFGGRGEVGDVAAALRQPIGAGRPGGDRDPRGIGRIGDGHFHPVGGPVAVADGDGVVHLRGGAGVALDEGVGIGAQRRLSGRRRGQAE
jgi:hypothetical protein